MLLSTYCVRYVSFVFSEVYTSSDVQSIVSFAHERGVIVLPEFDAPAHAAAGWQWGEEEGKGKMVRLARFNFRITYIVFKVMVSCNLL